MSWVARVKNKARTLKIELHAMWFAVRHPGTTLYTHAAIWFPAS